MTDDKLRFSISERGKNAKIAIPSAGRDINILDYEDVKTAIDEVHNIKGEKNWVFLGYEGESDDTLILIGCGSDPAQIQELVSDNSVAYGLVRVVDNVDGVVTHRYALIVWMGDKVPGMKKAKISVNKAAVLSVIGHFNVEILASATNEMTPEILVKKVTEASGSAVKTVQPQPKPQASAASKPIQKQSSGVFTPETKNAVVKFNDEEDIKEAIKNIRNDSHELNWVLVGYVGNNNNTIEMVGKGDGGYTEMATLLKDDQVNYGLFRVDDKIDQTVTVKFLYFYFLGENVKPLFKGKVSTHKGTMEDFFSPYHTKINATSVNDFSEASIQAKLQELKGSKSRQ